jgi:hypothetical protein
LRVVFFGTPRSIDQNSGSDQAKTKLRLDQTCLDSLCAFGAAVLADGQRVLHPIIFNRRDAESAKKGVAMTALQSLRTATSPYRKIEATV